VDVSSRFDVAGFGVIVTGGASGLGLAYGEVLAAHGARVTLIDVDAGAVAAQASRLQSEGLDVRGAVADVTDHSALDRAIDEAAGAYGRLDVAFANAGIDPGVGFVGAWAGDALRYAGKVGAGFTGASLGDLHRRLSPLTREQSPFVDAPRARDVTWVQPRLVAQLAFTERTGDGRLRHPVFLGLREDKDPTDVVWTGPPSRAPASDLRPNIERARAPAPGAATRSAASRPSRSRRSRRPAPGP